MRSTKCQCIIFFLFIFSFLLLIFSSSYCTAHRDHTSYSSFMCFIFLHKYFFCWLFLNLIRFLFSFFFGFPFFPRKLQKTVVVASIFLFSAQVPFFSIHYFSLFEFVSPLFLFSGLFPAEYSSIPFGTSELAQINGFVKVDPDNTRFRGILKFITLSPNKCCNSELKKVLHTLKIRKR